MCVCVCKLEVSCVYIFHWFLCTSIYVCVCVCVCKLEVSCVYIFHWFLLQDIYWKLYFVVMHDNYLVHMHILYIYIYVWYGMQKPGIWRKS